MSRPFDRSRHRLSNSTYAVFVQVWLPVTIPAPFRGVRLPARAPQHPEDWRLNLGSQSFEPMPCPFARTIHSVLPMSSNVHRDPISKFLPCYSNLIHYWLHSRSGIRTGSKSRYFTDKFASFYQKTLEQLDHQDPTPLSKGPWDMAFDTHYQRLLETSSRYFTHSFA